MTDKGNVTISTILFFVVFIFLVTAVIVAYSFMGPLSDEIPCNNNYDCSLNQTCLNNVCQNIVCSSAGLECPNGSICLGGFCQTQSCNEVSNCVNSSNSQSSSNSLACVIDNKKGNYCSPVGNICKSNIDCPGLFCDNGICKQCTSEANCLAGQYCDTTNSSGICRYPTVSTIMQPNYTFIPALNSGNLGKILPQGYSCSTADYTLNSNVISCGISLTGSTGSTGLTGSCLMGYCVNQVCRCVKGKYMEMCQKNSDCTSNFCLSIDGGKSVCAEGPNCIGNYNSATPNKTGYCTNSNPFCVNGFCKSDSLNAYCKNNSQCSFTNGMTGNYYCVNGRCTTKLGNYGEICSNGIDCLAYNNSKLNCVNSVSDNTLINVCRP